MSKICHIVTDTAHGPLTYADLTSGGRGVTGSEQAMLYLAKAQAEQGHQVVCYLPTNEPGFQYGVEMLDIRPAWPRMRRADSADVVVSWLSADPLRHIGNRPLKVHSLQINDWALCAHNYEKYVDVFVAVSEAHKKHLLSEQGNPGPYVKWEILPNGTELSRFNNPGAPRVPNRVAYLSSPDRGLHWLLAMWPEIRFAHPDAELHIFYEVQKWIDHALLLNSEVGLRANYVIRKVNELSTHGVVLRGASSPEALSRELFTSDIMCYPCDPTRFTEGFGVAVLDACAAGVVPVITDADAFGEIYNKPDTGIFVVPREDDRRWTDRFLERTLWLLENRLAIEDHRIKVQSFVQRYDWKLVAKKWDDMILKYKRD